MNSLKSGQLSQANPRVLVLDLSHHSLAMEEAEEMRRSQMATWRPQEVVPVEMGTEITEIGVPLSGIGAVVEMADLGMRTRTRRSKSS